MRSGLVTSFDHPLSQAFLVHDFSPFTGDNIFEHGRSQIP